MACSMRVFVKCLQAEQGEMHSIDLAGYACFAANCPALDLLTCEVGDLWRRMQQCWTCSERRPGSDDECVETG